MLYEKLPGIPGRFRGLGGEGRGFVATPCRCSMPGRIGTIAALGRSGWRQGRVLRRAGWHVLRGGAQRRFVQDESATLAGAIKSEFKLADAATAESRTARLADVHAPRT
jgi:hypothetical protein